MANQLYTVKRSDQISKVFSLNPNASLADIRDQLEKKQFMNKEDVFLLNDVAFDRDQEGEVTLSQLVPTGGVLYIGASTIDIGKEDSDRNIMTYKKLSLAQKQALFSNIEITRGLVINDNGFQRSFKDIVSWGVKIPDESKPRIITEVVTDYSFNKTTSELKTTGVEKTSVSFSSPFLSAESEYKHEKSKITSTSKVKEYLVSKYIVRKVQLNMDIENMVVSPDFVKAVKKAVQGNEDSIDGYSNLIQLLNDWGYYVPSKFTLGGMLYSKETTEISDFSQAETEKNEFSVSFKGTFEKIGGGAGYSNATGSEKTTTTSSKYKATTLIQVGGTPGTDNDYTKWMKGLDPATNWDAASYEIIIPSIALLWSNNAGLASTCVKLINKFYSYAAVKDRQSYLDMLNYGTQTQSYYDSPF